MVTIPASSRMDFYRKLNKALYQEELGGTTYGSRYIVNGLTAELKRWWDPFPKLEEFGYPSQVKRLARLQRNYFEEKSHAQARDLFARKLGDTNYTGAPLSYTTNKVKQSGNLGCIVGGALTWKAPRGTAHDLEVDFLFRVSETVKVLPADLVFLDCCIRYSVPEYMYSNLDLVRLHFAGCYVVPGFFPQLVAMMYNQEEGRLEEEIQLKDTTFGRACFRGLQQAMDLNYRSKWKPQIRIQTFFRRTIPSKRFSSVLSQVSLV